MTLQLLQFYNNVIWLTITKYIKVWLSKLINNAVYHVLYSANTLQFVPFTAILFMEGIIFSCTNKNYYYDNMLTFLSTFTVF